MSHKILRFQVIVSEKPWFLLGLLDKAVIKFMGLGGVLPIGGTFSSFA